MKKIIGSLSLLFLSQLSFGQEKSQLVSYASEVNYSNENKLNFVRLKDDQRVYEAGLSAFINSTVFNNGINRVAVMRTESDQLGYTHTRFSILQNGVVVANKLIVAHCMEGKLMWLNGDLSDIPAAENGFLITEKTALAGALAKVNAKKYKWENLEEERHMREALNQPDFSYQPKAEKVVVEKDGKLYNAFRFNIYAEEPLYRANVYVNAANGKVMEEENLICHANAPGTAVTKYSGTQTLTVDFTGSLYRFRENQRGQGVETYNMKNGTTYSATDFTSTTANWTTTGFDQGAADAHWGAQKTYDYYWTQHNRNSINNAGFKLLSYVHYQTNYQNAFWDGTRMTYGDGNGGSMKIFTSLDVCGHEITHGLTSNTGNLTYMNESGALNESFSDIFGTAIENYGRPANWNWKIGEDITAGGGGLRDMSNPTAYGDPNTYMGPNYYTGTADNGGVHTNSGVSNYWFYLLSNGGAGTNGVGNPYSVTGIGISNAAKIAFRALTVYFTPSTNYANARLLTIQAAKDLFGACSNEVIATTRAWYAVNVGANYIPGQVGPNFTSNTSNFCASPATVNFVNTTLNGLSYTWDFGDGTTSTAVNPSKVYNTPGNYQVKLVAVGCANVKDSVTKPSFITIYPPVSPPTVSGATGCENSPILLNGTGGGGFTLKWYDNPAGSFELGTGNTFATPGLSSTTTYYAGNTFTFAPFFGGMPSNTGGNYVNTGSTNYLIFDVMQTGVLNSVVVYAQTVSQPHTIELRNSLNQVIYSTTVQLNLGMNTVTLNYNLTPGTNYRLGLNATSPVGLFRSTSGVAFPYNIGGCVNIKSSSANGAYYYFYNWKVSLPGCSSPLVPVVATVYPLPSVALNAPTLPICKGDHITVTGAPAGGNYVGQSLQQNGVFAPVASGVYTVAYTVSDANCSNTAEAEIMVQECTGIAQQNANAGLSVYPNPAKDKLFVGNAAAGSVIRINDASGRLVLTREVASSEEALEIGSLSNGMYIIHVQDGAQPARIFKLIKE